jgi:hypothetical protein
MHEKMALIADFADVTGRAVDLVDLRTAGEPLLGQVLDHCRRIRCGNAAYAENSAATCSTRRTSCPMCDACWRKGERRGSGSAGAQLIAMAAK